MKVIQSDAGKLSLLATGTLSLDLFQSIAALQSKNGNKNTVQNITDTRSVVNCIRCEQLTSLTYRTLAHDTIHICL